MPVRPGDDNPPAVDGNVGGAAEGGSGPPRRSGVLSRRRVLLGLGAAGAAGVAGVSWVLNRSSTGETVAGGVGADGGQARDAGATGPHELGDFPEHIQSGGPPPDGIPSIDSPVYVPAEQVDFLRDDDVVFGQIVDGRPRAFPQLVLVWHEIVNDVDSAGPVSVTYCPLTGSTVGFRGHSGIEQFGTSGSLVNSNLLMYDRTHESAWPQILAQAITGPRRSDTLEEFPLEWTTWQRWRGTFPDTDVLSAETGFVRRYGDDPYGSYNPIQGYYEEGSRRLFPVMASDDRFDDKAIFLGAKLGDSRLAVRKELAVAQEVVEAEMDGTPVVFLHDPELATARAFRADTAGGSMRLELDDTPGQYVDRRSGAVWDSWGSPVSRTDTPLTRVLAYDVMWFSWVAFFPHTSVVA